MTTRNLQLLIEWSKIYLFNIQKLLSQYLFRIIYRSKIGSHYKHVLTLGALQIFGKIDKSSGGNIHYIELEIQDCSLSLLQRKRYLIQQFLKCKKFSRKRSVNSIKFIKKQTDENKRKLFKTDLSDRPLSTCF